jgi:hypothetical protein
MNTTTGPLQRRLAGGHALMSRPPGRPRSPPTVTDLNRALEKSQEIALRLGSAWSALPGATRKPMLDHAHELIDLLVRAKAGVGGIAAISGLRHPL